MHVASWCVYEIGFICRLTSANEGIKNARRYDDDDDDDPDSAVQPSLNSAISW